MSEGAGEVKIKRSSRSAELKELKNWILFDECTDIITQVG